MEGSDGGKEAENTMAYKLMISDEMDLRLQQFKKVAEAILDREISDDDWAELVLGRGLNGILEDVIGPQDKQILIESFQLLARQYPKEVCEFMVDILRRGEESIREAAKRKIGYELPEHKNID